MLLIQIEEVNQMITSRKIKLAIVSDNKDTAYSFIREETRNQNRALNVAYTHLYFEYVAQEKLKQSDKEYQQHLEKYKNAAAKKYQEFLTIKEKSKSDENLQPKMDKVRETYNKAMEKVYKIEKDYSKKAREIYQQSVGLAKQTRLGKLIKSEFDLHYDTVDRIGSNAMSDFSNDRKSGILSGERSLRNYKKTNPLMVRARSMKLYEEDNNFYIKWINDIVFKIIISAGSKQRMNIAELKSVFIKLLSGQCKMCDSSISLDKGLILNLSIDMPITKENVFIPNRVLGVDLGLKIPAYVSLNDTHYIKGAIGNIDDFLKVRTGLQSQRRRLQKSLQSTGGGKGRRKKLQALERLKTKEKNFVNTYNHFLSKNIVQFAVKNNAGAIHMEELKFDKMKNKSLLRNWSYYQLQTMVEYKAKSEGIEVYYVDASYTSQTCSKCGNLEEGQREARDTFVCKKCGYNVHADYNASQNIAKSTKAINKTIEITNIV
ncbi:transposase [Bacillus toyonensis]|nr:transposase [Bacillus toyonensis]